MDGHLEPLLRELLGAALREERRRQGRTLAGVAEAAGISMQHLSDVERGRKDPSSEMLAAITGALGVRVPQLLGQVAETAPEPAAAGLAPRLLDLTEAGSAGAHRRAAAGPAQPGIAVLAGSRRSVTLLAAA